MKRIVIIFAVVMVCGMSMMAQTKITGTVVDNENKPMMGIYVTPESGGEMVATDIDGRFEIIVQAGEMLTFSSMETMTKTETAVDGMVVVVALKEKWNWRKQGWKHILLVEYGYNATDLTTHSIGIRYGMCKHAGWFLGVRYLTTEFKFPQNVYTMKDGVIDDSQYDWGTPVTTGVPNVNQLSLSAGVLWRMYIPLYGYAGAGCGYRKTEYQTTGGAWFTRTEDKQFLLTAEFGLIGEIHNFSISAGCELVFTGIIEVYPKIGIGFAIPDKKFNNKK